MRTKVSRVVTALLLAGLSCGALAGEYIYQWKDKTGNMVYSDNPPPGNIPSRMLRRDAVGEAGTPAATAGGKSTADREVEAKKRGAEQADAKAKTDKEAADAKARSENCTAAKNQLAALESGQRMSRFNDKGEREILDDAQRAAEIDRAKKVIAESCK